MGTVQIPRFVIITAIEGSGSIIASVFASEAIGKDNTFVLRLIKKGSRYSAFYSTDGEQFEKLGSTDIVLKTINVGPIAVKGHPSRRQGRSNQGNEIDPPFSAGFDYFRIESR